MEDGRRHMKRGIKMREVKKKMTNWIMKNGGQQRLREKEDLWKTAQTRMKYVFLMIGKGHMTYTCGYILFITVIIVVLVMIVPRVIIFACIGLPIAGLFSDWPSTPICFVFDAVIHRDQCDGDGIIKGFAVMMECGHSREEGGASWCWRCSGDGWPWVMSVLCAVMCQLAVYSAGSQGKERRTQ